MGHFTIFLQVLQGQIKDQQQRLFSSGEVVDMGTTGNAVKLSCLTGLALPSLGCETNVPCDKVDALHTEIDASPLESNLSPLPSHSIY